MQTQNNDSQAKKNLSKKAGMNLDSIRREQEKKDQPKEELKTPGTGNNKKSQ